MELGSILSPWVGGRGEESTSSKGADSGGSQRYQAKVCILRLKRGHTRLCRQQIQQHIRGSS